MIRHADFSDTFDEKLVGDLRYKVPEIVGEAVAALHASRVGGAPFGAALDAGCGTGLAGPYIRPLVAGLRTPSRPTPFGMP